jgi:hypothetical protein
MTGFINSSFTDSSAIAYLPTSQITRTRSILVLVLFRTLLALYSQLNSQSKSHSDWWSVSQSVLVSSPSWGSWADISSCLTVTVVFIWCALSDDRTGLSVVRDRDIFAVISQLSVCTIYTYILHVIGSTYIQYEQGLGQSGSIEQTMPYF